ncbi:MAG: hypothetical protein E5V33_24835, partial [Mesorhizobium sp.]
MNRADRRRADKEHARKIDAGIDLDDLSPEMMGSLIRRTYSAVEQARRFGSVAPILGFMNPLIDKSTQKAARYHSIACSKGCWYCCTVWVAASIPEVIHFANTVPAGQKAGFSTRLDESLSQFGHLSFDQRGDTVTPCPALVDKLCSNYQNRPNTCRTAMSADADICRRSYVELSGEDIPTPMSINGIRGIFVVALECALVHAGLVPGAYEFQAALKRTLADPTIERRWLNG